MSKKSTGIASGTAGDFAILPLTILPHPAFPKSATHYLYVRPNAPRNPTPEEEQLQKRQLFLANIPIDSGLTSIRTLFKTLVGEAGRVADVSFGNDRKMVRESEMADDNGEAVRGGTKVKRSIAELKVMLEQDADLPQVWDTQVHTSGSSAVVLFVDSKSADIAMKAIKKRAKKGEEILWQGEDLSKRYKAHHALKFPNPDVLTAHINSYLTTFNTLQTLKERNMRKLSAPDEDGFITVTRQGSRAAPVSLAAAEAAKAREDERKKKAAEELTNFYRFQGREKRKAREMELKRKFEEDRKKVEGMRQKRMKTS
ncbi:hypothetical protein EJ05DRAFT_500142 [Pseudovirgaria hyperparasitica]|uniref:Ribosomal RNA-processing protein 7 n=1 Tax=Pseudovirgaria hyperparasitica TaxID=470096 RepID=A0A6A6W7L6_9PEZI|nr:uncharacterized protein EJ05DRAFT_500142 [Pseudovirgaria hyperparasitica]KAF2758623.1 hypothetical protein EJ05DRAFT_500142 [Pseudovirgaria hyperparasitica]